MSGLHTFRSRLARLRYQRALVRWQTAVARALMLGITALSSLLLVDLLLRLETVPRAAVILVAVSVVAWQVIRRVGPHLSRNETVVDVALLLERMHGVDSDLVAALQFESSANGSAGSLELQQAVIERAAKLSETLDFRSAVPKDDARRAAWYAAIAVLFVAVGWLVFPNHASAFWNRLCLGDAQYPTRTSIDEVTINGRTDAASVVEGETAVFRVTCAGITPDEGTVRLRGIETGDSTSVKLKRVNEKSDVAIYEAGGPALNEPVEVSIQVGDAITRPRHVAIVRRPLVELTIEAVAPTYMQRETIRQQERYVQVMEGSSVELSIRCTNGKRLTQARFALIAGGKQTAESEAIAFASVDQSGMKWLLNVEASGLTRVDEDFQFRVAVVDADGLGTYHPIEGAIRVRSDRAPTATLATLHHAILPNAGPAIVYTAEDDFGVGALVLHGRRAGTHREPAEADSFTLDLLLPEATTPVRAEHVLDLRPLKLVEGDKALVWIEVTDYRGDWPGVSTLSEPIELEVTDERGVLDAILRSDADAEQMLTDAIEKELGLRGER